MIAVMRGTEYWTKPTFVENFMSDWKKILGKNHIIQNLKDCDFDPIYEWHQREKEKKQMSIEEKKALKEEKMKQEEKYMWAIVDGVKKKDAPIPGQSWKEIRHDNTVTWLAFWNDPINPKEFKYVFLAASSSLKGQSDKEKYEKSRKLKGYIEGIRAVYTKNFSSKDVTKQQVAVATYLIDKLALRACNEKAVEVSRCREKLRESNGNPEISLRLEAAEVKLMELKSNMAILGKEATATVAAVESQLQRLTLQRLITMMFYNQTKITNQCCSCTIL